MFHPAKRWLNLSVHFQTCQILPKINLSRDDCRTKNLKCKIHLCVPNDYLMNQNYRWLTFWTKHKSRMEMICCVFYQLITADYISEHYFTRWKTNFRRRYFIASGHALSQCTSTTEQTCERNNLTTQNNINVAYSSTNYLVSGQKSVINNSVSTLFCKFVVVVKMSILTFAWLNGFTWSWRVKLKKEYYACRNYLFTLITSI